MKKYLALHAKLLLKLYKPTTTTFELLHTPGKNEDTTQGITSTNQSGQFRIKGTMTVGGAWKCRQYGSDQTKRGYSLNCKGSWTTMPGMLESQSWLKKYAHHFKELEALYSYRAKIQECKTNLDESSRALGEATSSRDSSLIALQTKQTELEKYTALNDLTTPKCTSYNGLISTLHNPKYLKKAQSDKPRLYEIPYDTSDPANRFCPDGEDTVTLEKESRSNWIKDK
ncbi:hypothetical protein Tco_1226597 [Tanacetum coccineum]